jgi:hypothetical protein
MLIFNELPTAFPWYDKIEKQQRYREHQTQATPFKLISPYDALLPFEVILTGADVLLPTQWLVYDSCGTQMIDLTANLSSLKGRTVDAGTYVYYNGEALTATLGTSTLALDLPPGDYYSMLIFGTSYTFFSEIFTVPLDRFSVNDPAVFMNYLKISFTNSCDINPVLYTGNNGQQFTQTIYLDTFVNISNPEFEESGEKDKNDNTIPSFQKMVVNYSFSVAVPDFVKIALTSLEMHTSINVVTKKGVRSGTMDAVTTSASVQDAGVYTVLDVAFRQIVMVKRGCCDNMSLSTANVPVNIIKDDGSATANIKSSYQVPATANSAIIAISNWMICIVPVTPGVRYYINNWNSGRRELGFYAAGDISAPDSLSVISSSQVTKIANDTGAYTVVAPAGAAYMAFNIRNAGAEGTEVLQGLTVWAANPGRPYMIRAQITGTTTTNIIAGIPRSTWGTIQASAATTGPWTTVATSLTPDQLLAGVVANGNYAYWRVGAQNYNTDYGYTPYIQRTA